MLLNKVFSALLGSSGGEISTMTCAADVAGSLTGTCWYFYVLPEGGVLPEVAYQVYYRVAGVGADPAGAFVSIPVDIALNAGAAVVAAATRLVLQNYLPLYYDAVINGAGNDVVITGRWAGGVTNIADGVPPTVTFTPVTTLAGAASDYNLVAFGAVDTGFMVRPTRSQVMYLRRAKITLDDTAGGALGNTLGDIAAVADGLIMQVRNHDFGILYASPPVRSNMALISLGKPAVLAPTTLTVDVNFVDYFGGEVPIDGRVGQDFNIPVTDNLTGIIRLFVEVYGHFA